MAVRHTEAIAEDVERVLGTVMPAIDVVDVTVLPGGVLRVLIDHPDGVDLSSLHVQFLDEVTSGGR